MTNFPIVRLRRNRSDKWLRDILQETHLRPSDLIQPFFVTEGTKQRQAITQLPDIYRFSIDNLLKEIENAMQLGIKAIALFPVVEQGLKSLACEEAYNPHNLACRAIAKIKQNFDIGVIADVALDPYNLNGHDGLLIDNQVDNDESLKILAKQSLVLAQAGADIIAPSDMMDGRIGFIRKFLDQNGYHQVKLLSYSVKYASNFYGPFRDAIGSQSNLGQDSKQSYQMSFHNIDEAFREVEMDLNEGADMIMVKPALPYLDIVRMLKDNFKVNIFAYHVSGEYAALKAAAEKRYLDYDKVLYESMIACKRAGATSIFCYDSLYLAKKLVNNRLEISDF